MLFINNKNASKIETKNFVQKNIDIVKSAKVANADIRTKEKSETFSSMSSSIDLNEYRDILPQNTKQEDDDSFNLLAKRYADNNSRASSNFKMKSGKNLIIEKLNYSPVKISIKSP